jgi:hypothetical protein
MKETVMLEEMESIWDGLEEMCRDYALENCEVVLFAQTDEIEEAADDAVAWCDDNGHKGLDVLWIKEFIPTVSTMEFARAHERHNISEETLEFPADDEGLWFEVLVGKPAV